MLNKNNLWEGNIRQPYFYSSSLGFPLNLNYEVSFSPTPGQKLGQTLILLWYPGGNVKV